MNWTYETKCRRCGRVHEWFVAELSEMSYKEYLSLIFTKFETPSGYNCQCKKSVATVHDIISYNYDLTVKDK